LECGELVREADQSKGAGMTCKHSIIQTYRFEDGDPAMWACAECRHKFVPFSQMLQEVADEREQCAAVCEQHGKSRKAMEHYAALTYAGAAHECAAAIRARGQV